MRRGFPSLARLVQEGLKRDPHAGDLYVFRGRRSDLIKVIWHDSQGACLFTKRLERGRFIWPSLPRPRSHPDCRAIVHVRGAPCHPQTQGKIERWHQTPHSARETITCLAISKLRSRASSSST